MKRNDLPEKAFAAVVGDNRLLLHHTPDVRDGSAHATVDIDRLALCLKLVEELPEEVRKPAKAHLLEHARAFARFETEAGALQALIERGQAMMTFAANLSTIQHIPPIFGPAHGSARFVLNSKTRELFYSIEAKELSTAGTGISLHIGLSGTPTDEAELLVDLPNGRIVEGSIELTEEQMDMLLKGHVQVNVKTSEYPMGEIRGQVLPTFPDDRVNAGEFSGKPRVGSGNPNQTREPLPEEGDGAPQVKTESGDMTKDMPEAEGGQEDMDPEADTSAKPAAEPGGVEAGQEDLTPTNLTDERPQKEPGQGGGATPKDATPEDGQEEDKPKSDTSTDPAPKEPGSVEGQKDKKWKDGEAADNEEDHEESDSTLASLLDSVSSVTAAFKKRLTRREIKKETDRLGKPKPSDLVADVLGANAHLDAPAGGDYLVESNLTDPNNAVLKMELALLDTPEKLKSFATPTPEQQEDRKQTVLTASFTQIGDKVVKFDGDFADPKIEEADKLLPKISNSMFTEDGRFLGMKARILEEKKLGTTETLALVMEPDDSPEGEGFSFGLFMDIMRDAEGTVREVRMLDSFVPAQFLKDFGGFLQALK